MKCAGSRNDSPTAQHNTLSCSLWASFLFFFFQFQSGISWMWCWNCPTNTNSVTLASTSCRGPAAQHYNVFRVLSTEIPFACPHRAFDWHNCRCVFFFAVVCFPFFIESHLFTLYPFQFGKPFRIYLYIKVHAIDSVHMNLMNAYVYIEERKKTHRIPGCGTH